MASLSSHSAIPNHVAIIMDGNNRWASTNKLPGVAGHQKGVERAREAVEFAVESGLKTLTLFAFSSCLLYTSPSPRDRTRSRMPSSA